MANDLIPVKIRPCTPDDRQELFRMRTSLWPDSEESEVVDLLQLPAPEGVALVAELGSNQLVGFAEIRLRNYAEGCLSSPVAYLEGIWVDPEQRRLGVAKDLLREGEIWARGEGLSEFASDCELGNEASRMFHAALGFTESGRLICFRRDLDSMPE